MKLSEWAHIAEITSAIAVVISLIYIGLEVNQNTAAVTANTRQSMIDYGREQSEILVTNETLSNLVDKGESNPATLTPLEQSQFYEFTIWRFAMWESSFLNHEKGLLDDDSWIAWDAYYRFIMIGKPGYAQFWSDTRATWHPLFMDHVDAITMQ